MNQCLGRMSDWEESWCEKTFSLNWRAQGNEHGRWIGHWPHGEVGFPFLLCNVSSVLILTTKVPEVLCLPCRHHFLLSWLPLVDFCYPCVNRCPSPSQRNPCQLVPMTWLWTYGYNDWLIFISSLTLWMFFQLRSTPLVCISYLVNAMWVILG